jgi:hypothetical protein
MPTSNGTREELCGKCGGREGALPGKSSTHGGEAAGIQCALGTVMGLASRAIPRRRAPGQVRSEAATWKAATPSSSSARPSPRRLLPEGYDVRSQRAGEAR